MPTPLPIKLMKAKPIATTVASNWPNDGSSYAGRPFQWNVIIEVSSQSHSSPDTRVPYEYNAQDIQVGDWISNATGGLAWKIVSIDSNDNFQIQCKIEDVNQHNTYNDTSTVGDGGIPLNVDGFIFTLDQHGVPLIQGVINNVLTANWQADLQSRFFADVEFTPVASSTQLGGVKPGNHFVVDEFGSMTLATQPFNRSGDVMNGTLTVGAPVLNDHAVRKIDLNQAVGELDESLSDLQDQMIEQLGTKLSLTGGEITGDLTVSDPVQETSVTNKRWVRSQVSTYPTVSQAKNTNIPATIQQIQVLGYDSLDDAGAAKWCVVSAEPTHLAKFQSLDGRWWELNERVVDPRMLGARVDGTTNDEAAVQAAWSYLLYYSSQVSGDQYGSKKQATFLVPSGRLLVRPAADPLTGRLVLTSSANGVGTGISIKGHGSSSVMDGISIMVTGGGWSISDLSIVDTRNFKTVKGSFGIKVTGSGGRSVRIHNVYVRDMWTGLHMNSATNLISMCKFDRNREGVLFEDAGDTELTNCTAMNNTHYGYRRKNSGEVKLSNCRARDNGVANDYFDACEPNVIVENYTSQLTLTSSTVWLDTPGCNIVQAPDGGARVITSKLFNVTVSQLSNPHMFIGASIPVDYESMVKLRFSGSGDLTSLSAGAVALTGNTVAWTGDLTSMTLAISEEIKRYCLTQNVVVETKISGSYLYVAGPASWSGLTTNVVATGSLALSDSRKLIQVNTSEPHGYAVGMDVMVDCGVDNRGIERVLAVLSTTSFVVFGVYAAGLAGTCCRPNRLKRRGFTTLMDSSVSGYNGSGLVVQACGHNWIDLKVGAVRMPYTQDATTTWRANGWDRIYDANGGGINDHFVIGGNTNFTLVRGAFSLMLMGERTKSLYWIDERMDPSHRSGRIVQFWSGRGRQEGTNSDIYFGGVSSGFGGVNYFSPSGQTEYGDGHMSLFAPNRLDGLENGEAKAWNRVGASETGVRIEIASVPYTLGKTGGNLYSHILGNMSTGNVGVGLFNGTSSATLASQINGTLSGDLEIDSGNKIIFNKPVKYKTSGFILAADDNEARVMGVEKFGQYVTPSGVVRVRLTSDPADTITIFAEPATDTYKVENTPSTFGQDWAFSRASTAYQIDSSGALISVASDTMRYSRDGSLVQTGWMLEKETTNYVRNPRAVGAATGSPGTVPTNWSNSWSATTDGLSRQIVGVGVEDNIPYIDIRLSGTATATRNDRGFAPEANATIATTNGQIWSQSVYIKHVGGTWPIIGLRTSAYQSGGTTLAGNVSTAIAKKTGTLKDCLFTQTYTVANALAVSIVPQIYFNYTTNDVIDVTIRIGGWQFEKGYPSSLTIPGSDAIQMTTRASDKLLLSSNSLTKMLGNRAGTAFIEMTIPNLIAGTIFDISDGTSNNRISVMLNTTGTLYSSITLAGNTTTSAVTNAITAKTRVRIGIKWYGNGIGISVNGGSVVTLSSQTATSFSSVQMFGDFSALNNMSGTIHQTYLYTKIMDDTSLVSYSRTGVVLPQ